jgi:recombination protein RecR
MNDMQCVEALTCGFSRLPGVGVKSAERMAYAIIEMGKDDALALAKAIEDAKEKMGKCPVCGFYSENGSCQICSDPKRDHSSCVVVSMPKDVIAIERMGKFNGVYHVLGGTINPVKGIGANDLKIDELVSRIEPEGIKEIILATNPTLEGETTALLIAKLLEGKNVIVSRLAYGLPMGSSLDYADSLTLSKAFDGRRKI